jgi:hypothetical protein
MSVQNFCHPPKTNERASDNYDSIDKRNVLLPLTPTPKEQTSMIDNAKDSNSKSSRCLHNSHHYSPVLLSSNHNLLLGNSSPRITKRHSLSPNDFSQYQVPFEDTNENIFSVPPLAIPFYSFHLSQTPNHSSDCVDKDNNVSISLNKSNITNSSKQLKSILMKPNNNKMSDDRAATPITKRKKHVTFANVSPSPTKFNPNSTVSISSHSVSKENDTNLNLGTDTKKCVSSFPLDTDSKSSQVHKISLFLLKNCFSSLVNSVFSQNMTVTPNPRRLQPFNPLDSEIFKPLTTAMREQLKSPALSKTKRWGFYHGRWGFFRK